MAKTDVWMPIFIGDYLSSTTHLTTQQHGAYMLLLMAAWKMEGKLPNDDEQLSAICRMSLDDWKKTKRLLIGFFSVCDSFWIQQRLLSEYLRSQQVRASKKVAGSLGGRPKKQNESEQKPNGLANQKQNETPSPSPSHKSKVNKFTSDDTSTAEFIFDGVRKLNPDHKSPNIDSWSESVRLMRERDNRPDHEIRSLFEWANQHRFWAKNILSPDKLREKFDQLTIQRSEENKNATSQPIPFRNSAPSGKPVIDHDDTSWADGLEIPAHGGG